MPTRRCCQRMMMIRRCSHCRYCHYYCCCSGDCVSVDGSPTCDHFVSVDYSCDPPEIVCESTGFCADFCDRTLTSHFPILMIRFPNQIPIPMKILPFSWKAVVLSSFLGRREVRGWRTTRDVGTQEPVDGTTLWRLIMARWFKRA